MSGGNPNARCRGCSAPLPEAYLGKTFCAVCSGDNFAAGAGCMRGLVLQLIEQSIELRSANLADPAERVAAYVALDHLRDRVRCARVDERAQPMTHDVPETMTHEIPESLRLLALEMFEAGAYQDAASVLLGAAGASAMTKYRSGAWERQLNAALRGSGMDVRTCTCGRPFLTRGDDLRCAPCRAELVVEDANRAKPKP